MLPLQSSILVKFMVKFKSQKVRTHYIIKLKEYYVANTIHTRLRMLANCNLYRCCDRTQHITWLSMNNRLPRTYVAPSGERETPLIILCIICSTSQIRNIAINMQYGTDTNNLCLSPSCTSLLVKMDKTGPF